MLTTAVRDVQHVILIISGSLLLGLGRALVLIYALFRPGLFCPWLGRLGLVKLGFAKFRPAECGFTKGRCVCPRFFKFRFAKSRFEGLRLAKPGFATFMCGSRAFFACIFPEVRLLEPWLFAFGSILRFVPGCECRLAFFKSTTRYRRGAGNVHTVTAYPGILQFFKHPIGHIRRQIDNAVISLDGDVADELGINGCLIGNGAHDVARLDAMFMADVNAILHHAAAWLACSFAPRSVLGRFTPRFTVRCIGP